MIIKGLYAGSTKGHIITFLLTVWFTFGLGNVAYAVVANKLQEKPSSYRWGAMLCFVILFAMIGGALNPSTTTAPTPQQTPAPVVTPEPVATPAPVKTIDNPCPVCGDEGIYEPDYTEGFGQPSYSCNNGHGQVFFTPEAGVYIYWADYVDDYNLDANEMHYY